MIDYQYLERPRRTGPAGAPRTAERRPAPCRGLQRRVDRHKSRRRDGGLHRFRLYSSSYVKVFVDGKQVLERWRQNWNPWYHNFDLELTAGQAADVRIEWEPNGGYIALAPQRSAARGRPPLAVTRVRGGHGDRLLFRRRRRHGRGHLRLPHADRQGADDAANGPMASGRAASATTRRTNCSACCANIAGASCRSTISSRTGSTGRRTAGAATASIRSASPIRRRWSTRSTRLNARIMISVWPKFYPTTDNYKALDAIGGIYRRRSSRARRADRCVPRHTGLGRPGLSNAFYDPYNPAGAASSTGGRSATRWSAEGLRRLVARFRRARLPLQPVDRGARAADGPDRARPGRGVLQLLSAGPCRRRPRQSARVQARRAAVHPDPLGLRRNPARRRGAVVGRRGRRAGTILRDQISAGVNMSMSGVPNWTHDIGGFALEERYTNQDPEHLAEWRELNMRWFQFGAFSPLFRSHGEISEARDLRDRAGGLGDCTGRWTGTTGFATG